MKKRIGSLEELQDFATNFAAKLSALAGQAAPEGRAATLVLLSGELGAGKTTFTKALAHTLGVEEEVTSPTFVIEKIYKLKEGKTPFKHFIHIDAYRLEAGRELVSLGWQEIVADPGNLIFIEWPERVADILPEKATRLSFTFVDEGTRDVEWN